MFAGHCPVYKNRTSAYGISRGDVQAGPFEQANARAYSVPRWNALLGNSDVPGQLFVMWRVPIPQAVVAVVAGLPDPTLACMPPLGV